MLHPFLVIGAILASIGSAYAIVQFDTIVPLIFGGRWKSKSAKKRYALWLSIYNVLFLLLLYVAFRTSSLMNSEPEGLEWLTLGLSVATASVLGAVYSSLQISEAPTVVTAIINAIFPPSPSIPLGAADVGAAQEVLGFLEKVGGTYRTMLFVVASAIDSPLTSWYTLGVFTKFTDLSDEDQQRFVRRWMADSNIVFRSLASAFKALGSLGYYTDPRIWKEIDYPGVYVPHLPPDELHKHIVPTHISLPGEPPSIPPTRTKVQADDPAARVFGVARFQERTHRYKVIDHDAHVSADVCIIGSGAGGAVLARELARNPRIKRVIVLEKGSYYDGEDFNQRELDMIALLWKGGALTFNQDFSIFIGQGETLGGTTVINHAICIDTPKVVLNEWKEIGVGAQITDVPGFQDVLEVIKKEIHVAVVPDLQINANNQTLRGGAEKIGIPTSGRGPNPRNCHYCRECGFSHLGCHYDAKQSTLVTYLPAALETGNCAIVCDCEVETITFRGKRATGINATLRTKSGENSYRLRVDANSVIVSAGAINSSALLLRSKTPGTKKQAGRGLAIHPSPLVIAEFPHPIKAYQGIPMSYHVSEFSVLNGVLGANDSEPVLPTDSNSPRGGFMLESVFPNPGQFAAFLPGIGEQHKQLMKRLNYFAAAGILIRDTPKGVVSTNPSGEPVINYHLGPHDRRNLRDGIRKLCEIYFAEGATRVIITHRNGTIITREEYHKNPGILEQMITDENCGETELFMGAVHPQGGNRMGEDKRVCVVKSNGQHHFVKNLFVCDASVFPTATGVNPMLTVMGVAKKTAEFINNGGQDLFSDRHVQIDERQPWLTSE